MLPIHKNNADPLREHCSRPDATYDNIPTADREKLVASLLQEQGYLCAYCMSRINEDSMSVEHWKPQHPSDKGKTRTDAEKEAEIKSRIEYKNMLAVCDGGQGNPPRHQHCDKRRGNRPLLYNPAERAHHGLLQIRYSKSTGSIASENKQFDNEINTVLNLNINFLMRNRLSVIETVFSTLQRLPMNASKSSIQKMLNDWKMRNADGKMKEYAGVAIYFLEKRLKSAH